LAAEFDPPARYLELYVCHRYDETARDEHMHGAVLARCHRCENRVWLDPDMYAAAEEHSKEHGDGDLRFTCHDCVPLVMQDNPGG